MKGLLRTVRSWTRAPQWSAAAVAGFGCGLPLVLGLFSGHPGFLWATLGAFQASLANPLNRLGMPIMLSLTGLGAVSAALGFWAGSDLPASLTTYIAYGLILVWLLQYGREPAKAGFSLAICLCLGQGRFGEAELANPAAVATLFILGGLLVTLLAFGVRGMYGMRMWPQLPRLRTLLALSRRSAGSQPQPWLQQAMIYAVSLSFAGLAVNLLRLPHGYWLTLAVFMTLQLDLHVSIVRTLAGSLGILMAVAALTYLGHSLVDPGMMLLALLPLIFAIRAFQATRYGFFVMQTTLGFLLLSESLVEDWSAPQARLINAVIGVGIVLLVGLAVHLARRRGARRAKCIPTAD